MRQWQMLRLIQKHLKALLQIGDAGCE